MASQSLSFPIVILLTAIEAILVTTYLPEYLPGQNTLFWAFIKLTPINFIAAFLFYGTVYPYILDPLNRFPSGKGLKENAFYLLRPPTILPGSELVEVFERVQNDGIIVLRSPFHRNRLVLSGPEGLKEVLTTKAYDFQKLPQLRHYLREPLGDGLVVVEGGIHQFQRKHVMPAFKIPHIKNLYPLMWTKALVFTEYLSREVHGSTGSVEIGHWAGKVSMDVIGVAALGREFRSLDGNSDELVKTYEELLTPSMGKYLHFFLSVFGPRKLLWSLPWRLNREFNRIARSLSSQSRSLVRDKKQAIEKRDDEHFDILSLLIKSNDFSEDELADQLLTFLGAGHETTASAFTWITYVLATRPELQARLRSEVQEALPADAYQMNANHQELSPCLEGLPYLNGIMHETLRLFPTVPITLRVAAQDTSLLDKFVPRGTEIVISIWSINRSQTLWGADAEDFVPERWISDGKPNNHGGAASNYNFISFLHGPRSCIGKNFARAELRCLMAAFVRRFEWTLHDPSEAIVPAGVITIKPRDGLRLKLKAIQD